MYITIDRAGAIDALKKKIAECVVAESVVLRGIQGMETVKHHKIVNKSVITAIKKLGGYASLYFDYTPRIVLYFDSEKRIYKYSKADNNGVRGAHYFSETQVDIYFTGGYAEMIGAAQKRLEGIRESRKSYERELETIDAIVDDVKALQKAYKKVDAYSYIVRGAFGVK